MKPRESGPSRRCTMSRNRTAHLVAVLAICAAFPCSATAIAQERLFALHLTDLHIDEKISPFADPSTFCHGLVATGTQRGRFGQSYRKAAHYGHRGCDSAPALVADTFRFLSSKFGRDRVNETTRALINATLPVERLSFVLWTGDTGRHDKDPQLRREEEELYSANRKAVELFQSSFDLAQTAVIPSLGNWDTFPVDLMSPDRSLVLANLYEIWEPLFRNAPAEDRISETFLLPSSGGFFQRTVAPGLVVMSINTLWFFGRNTAVDDCQFPGPMLRPIPGDEQLLWIERKLKEARENGTQIIVIGHIAPLERDGYIYKPRCYVAFLELLGKYADRIVSSHFGHTNEDSMQFVAELLPDENPLSIVNDVATGNAPGLRQQRKQSELDYIFLSSSISIDLNHTKILVPLFTSPSVFPVFDPTFRVLDFAYGTPQQGQWTLKGWSQFAADLARANWIYERNHNNTIEFFEEYHTSLYGLSDMRPSSIMHFLPRFLANDMGIADRYETFSTVSGFTPFIPPDLIGGLKLPRWILIVFTFSAVAVFFAAMSWVLNFMFETTAHSDELQGLIADKDEFDDGD